MRITTKKLKIQLQALLRKIVILRDGECVTCPLWREILPNGWNSNSDILQAGHYYARGAKSIKYDLRNVHLQCKTCNGRHRFQQEAFTLYLLRKFGQKWLDKLTMDKYTPAPQIENLGSLLTIKEDLEKTYNSWVLPEDHILKEMEINE